MTIIELIKAVEDRTLGKDKLEAYRDSLAGVTAQMFLEMSEIEKREALFEKLENETETDRKRRWRATKDGQRQIELKNYIRASKEMLSSLKSRLYLVY